MRRVLESSARGVVAVTVIVALSTNVFAVPRDERDRDRGRDKGGIVKIIKKVVRALGDGLTVPIGSPRP